STRQLRPCRRMTRASLLLVIALGGSRCASAPPAAAPPKPPALTFEQKMASILRLEDQRVLRDPAPQVPPATTTRPVPGRNAPAAVVVRPPPPPDLTAMLRDEEARIRRRAALAVGHVGLGDGVQPLITLLSSETDPEVRQMAAFALGLLSDRRARD